MLKTLGAAVLFRALRQQPALAQEAQKPNIPVIFGDDIGQTNLSIYSEWPDGLPHAQHRPDRQGGRRLHRTTMPSRAAPPAA